MFKSVREAELLDSELDGGETEILVLVWRKSKHESFFTGQSERTLA